MLAYLIDASDPRNTYPAYWAPFEQSAKAVDCCLIAYGASPFL
jgi:hypothetical protein